MNDQNFINFSNNSLNFNEEDNSYNLYLSLFKEIFASFYGVQNLNFLKEAYLYFDKYGKQRKIDAAIFTEKRKFAILFEEFNVDVCEEYRHGDKKIVETSLRSQGWEIYYWSNKGKKDLVRRKTCRELGLMFGKSPKFMDHMHAQAPEPTKTNYIAPIIVLIAIVGAIIIFPKISDKLFSTTRVTDLPSESSLEVDYKKLGIEKDSNKKKTLKEKLDNIENNVQYDAEDF